MAEEDERAGLDAAVHRADDRAGRDPGIGQVAGDRGAGLFRAGLNAGGPGDLAARQLNARLAVQHGVKHQQALTRFAARGVRGSQPLDQRDAVGAGRDIARVGQAERRVARIGVGERVEVDAAIGAGDGSGAGRSAEAVQGLLQTVDQDVVAARGVRGVGIGDRHVIADGIRQLADEARRDAEHLEITAGGIAAEAALTRPSARAQGAEQGQGGVVGDADQGAQTGLSQGDIEAWVRAGHSEHAHAAGAIGPGGRRIARRAAAVRGVGLGVEAFDVEACGVAQVEIDLGIGLIAVLILNQVVEGHIGEIAGRRGAGVADKAAHRRAAAVAGDAGDRGRALARQEGRGLPQDRPARRVGQIGLIGPAAVRG
ncbi:hypothetical protein GALL_490960 [mine drainage metagenome]|uniref:Uncharacterized protein n=1 Tax=mine drainage metagenome TaxID=410659 RepID=A0A1J5PCF3_9ZZZZ